MKAYEDLANAIIIQAVKDYRGALKRLSNGRLNREAESTKRECERFFRSDWFGVLTKVDGKIILRELQKEVAE